MADVTEYGEVMLNAYIDEYGRRRIDALLEDGTKVMVVAVPPPPPPPPVAVPQMRFYKGLLTTSIYING